MYKKRSFLERFHDVGLFTKLSELLDHIELFFDFSFIIFEFDGLVLGKISLLMLSSGNVFDLSKLFPGSSFEDLGSAWVESGGDFGSFKLYVSVLVSDLLVLEVYFDC